MAELRKYATATKVLFPFIEFGGSDFILTAAHAAGDIKISLDEGDFATATNAFVHEGNGIYSLTLTAAELTATRIVITIIDQTSPKIWEDQAVLIDTYGQVGAPIEVTPDEVTLTAYVTLQEAADYFVNRISDWTDYTTTEKTQALNMSTSSIDRLNFAGDKTDEDQDLEFPRDDDTAYPQAIQDACCLCAAKILDGFNVDDVREEARFISQAYGSVKQAFNQHVLPHLSAGIPSSEAWDLLTPYLRQSNVLRFDRVS